MKEEANLTELVEKTNICLFEKLEKGDFLLHSTTVTKDGCKIYKISVGNTHFVIDVYPRYDYSYDFINIEERVADFTTSDRVIVEHGFSKQKICKQFKLKESGLDVVAINMEIEDLKDKIKKLENKRDGLL